MKFYKILTFYYFSNFLSINNMSLNFPNTIFSKELQSQIFRPTILLFSYFP